MRELKFKYAKAENFLCFGEDGIEINFEHHGSIVCIKGKNLDVNNEDGEAASNGSGKSSIPEIIVYALYGKTIKKPKKLSHSNIINNKTDKPLMVEFWWDDYRLVRTRDGSNKGTLRLWRSSEGVWNKKTEITCSGLPATQKEIEKIIGLTYESFINIFIFSDDNTLPFLECDGPTKREIVENILSLEKYRNYSQSAKDLLKNTKDKIRDLTKEYELLLSQQESATARISQIEKQEKDWHDARKKELDNLLADIKKKRDELEQSDVGAALASYQDAQEQIAELKQKIPLLEEGKNNLVELITTTTSKVELFDKKLEVADAEFKFTKKEYEECEDIVKTNLKIVEDIAKKTNKECPYCFSFIKESNFEKIIDNAEAVLQSQIPACDALKLKYEEAKTQKAHLAELKKKVDAGIAEFKTKLSRVNLEISNIYCEITELSKKEKPDSNVSNLLLCEQIESLKKQSLEKQEQLNGSTPFEDIKQTAIADLTQKVKDCENKKEEIKKFEKEISYYEFWVKAFGTVV